MREGVNVNNADAKNKDASEECTRKEYPGRCRSDGGIFF